jgi:hypothetical protein
MLGVSRSSVSQEENGMSVNVGTQEGAGHAGMAALIDLVGRK